jgi:hypothetical protein
MKSGWQGICSLRCNRRTFIQAGAGALTLLSLPARPAAAQAMQYGFLKPYAAAFSRQMDAGVSGSASCP